MEAVLEVTSSSKQKIHAADKNVLSYLVPKPRGANLLIGLVKERITSLIRSPAELDNLPDPLTTIFFASTYRLRPNWTTGNLVKFVQIQSGFVCSDYRGYKVSNPFKNSNPKHRTSLEASVHLNDLILANEKAIENASTHCIAPESYNELQQHAEKDKREDSDAVSNASSTPAEKNLVTGNHLHEV